MRVVAALLLLVGVALARPQNAPQITDSRSAYITKYDNESNGLGEYSYNVVGSDGQERGESRKVYDAGTDHEHAVVEGFYSYIAPDGERKLVGYKADDQGFQAEGEHLPPAASVRRRPPQLGIPSAAAASLAGGGLGR